MPTTSSRGRPTRAHRESLGDLVGAVGVLGVYDQRQGVNERVEQGALALEFFLVADLLGDVFLDGGEMRGHVFQVEYRGNGRAFNKILAVFAAVDEHPPPDGPGLDGAPQVGVHLGRRAAGFQKARRAAQDFLRGVAGGDGEGRIDVFNDARGCR